MNIFVTGASGYIGGSIAARLASLGHDVHGLIRDPARSDELRALGIEPVIGTLDDSAQLITEARAADAVVNAADSDHRGAVEALLEAIAALWVALPKGEPSRMPDVRSELAVLRAANKTGQDCERR